MKFKTTELEKRYNRFRNQTQDDKPQLKVVTFENNFNKNINNKNKQTAVTSSEQNTFRNVKHAGWPTNFNNSSKSSSSFNQTDLKTTHEINNTEVNDTTKRFQELGTKPKTRNNNTQSNKTTTSALQNVTMEHRLHH